MANSTRLKDYAAIAKSKIITDFSLSTPILAWSSEGFGLSINLITRRSDQSFPNTPKVGITTIRERYTVTPGPDIYGAYFTSVPPSKFERATLEFAANTVYIKLNQES